MASFLTFLFHKVVTVYSCIVIVTIVTNVPWKTNEWTVISSKKVRMWGIFTTNQQIYTVYFLVSCTYICSAYTHTLCPKNESPTYSVCNLSNRRPNFIILSTHKHYIEIRQSKDNLFSCLTWIVSLHYLAKPLNTKLRLFTHMMHATSRDSTSRWLDFFHPVDWRLILVPMCDSKYYTAGLSAGLLRGKP